MLRVATLMLVGVLMIGCRQAPEMPPSDPGPIAQALRDKIEATSRIPQRRDAPAIDRALQALYAARDYRPLWNDPAALNALMSRGYDALDSDGLRPADYVIDGWAAQARQVYADGASAEAQADFDLKISRSYLRALSHVAYGKVDPAQVGTRWETAPAPLDQRMSLAWAAMAAQTGGTGTAIAQARPQSRIYQELRASLAIHAGDAAKADQLRVNLERARWLLSDLPETYVLIDIAGYRAYYRRPSGEVWESKVIVGKPYRRTPAFRSQIDVLTLNPTWTVPPTIFKNDIAPKARKDAAGTLKQKHLRAIDGQGQDVPLSSIDWDNPRSVILRQEPGPQNPLGRVKISFDNPYLVYLHDTSNPERFDDETRAGSSGCIRVENAVTLAQMLIEDSDTESDPLEERLADGKTRDVKLAHTVPVILHYWTVRIADHGEVQFQDDIYDRDSKLLAALNRA